MTTQTTIKVIFNGEIRRFPCSYLGLPNFEQLCKSLREVLNHPLDGLEGTGEESFRILYKDSDDDWVSVLSQVELDAAVTIWQDYPGTLKISNIDETQTAVKATLPCEFIEKAKHLKKAGHTSEAIDMLHEAATMFPSNPRIKMFVAKYTAKHSKEAKRAVKAENKLDRKRLVVVQPSTSGVMANDNTLFVGRQQFVFSLDGNVSDLFTVQRPKVADGLYCFGSCATSKNLRILKTGDIDVQGGQGPWARFAVNKEGDDRYVFYHPKTNMFLTVTNNNNNTTEDNKKQVVSNELTLSTLPERALVQLSLAAVPIPAEVNVETRVSGDDSTKTKVAAETKEVEVEEGVLQGNETFRFVAEDKVSDVFTIKALKGGIYCFASQQTNKTLRILKNGKLDVQGGQGPWAKFKVEMTPVGYRFYHPQTGLYLQVEAISVTEGTADIPVSPVLQTNNVRLMATKQENEIALTFVTCPTVSCTPSAPNKTESTPAPAVSVAPPTPTPVDPKRERLEKAVVQLRCMGFNQSEAEIEGLLEKYKNDLPAVVNTLLRN